ncbi:hypothetical protein MLD38_016554 [Melastoma candidum]|uniref:Uncharacterized protein n=1 Tax=Melastoma candidum TaxID=119954 RepID=A0ACB9QPK9_9MYRT|nr:hypothetical protein MLD38_016554 [Melastoma candidum]
MAAEQTPPPSLHRGRRRNAISIFDIPAFYFESARILPSPRSSPSFPDRQDIGAEPKPAVSGGDGVLSRLTCNTCGAEFESLLDQRAHFKSDFHRINVKLSIAGKDTLKEEDFEELTADSFIDYEISSISGSDDEENAGRRDVNLGSNETSKQKIFVQLQTGERVSAWKPVVLNESDVVQYVDDNLAPFDEDVSSRCFKETEVIEKLVEVSHEPRDNTCLRVVLLASGGHFAGCVFDGNSVVAHKTFHRYVVRAKAGRKQSLKDAGGRAAHSAGASLRRYNELALKKDIRELLASWKPYFDACRSIFVHAPSNNRQLLFDGDKPCFSHSRSLLRHFPFIVRRPTFKEAKRVYNILTQVAYEDEDKEPLQTTEDSTEGHPVHDEGFICNKDGLLDCGALGEHASKIEVESGVKISETLCLDTSDEEKSIYETTPLHEAAKSGDSEKVMELLEEGLDPCVKDERGRTAYMLANEKEVRNVFRRFMALNLDKWDWHAAKVPSALTKEMEESQAAKQAEKEEKKKARAKELKKLRKAKEKQAQVAQAEAVQNVAKAATSSRSTLRANPQGISTISKEEELKRAQAIEREKRAAAAERRKAAAAMAQPNGIANDDVKCSCCSSSLAGKVPFHRYSYKYCSSSCMHAHKQILEDG